MIRAISSSLLFCCFAFMVWTTPPSSTLIAAQKKQKAKKTGKRSEPTKPTTVAAATPGGSLKTLKGFEVELLYSVPRESEGSWVSMCHDPKGRLIVSDQYGSLYRVTPSTIGEPASKTIVEKLSIDIGMAQGLLWAFDSLYVVVNAGGDKSGLFRITDTDNDDKLDKVELLRKFSGGGGEHDPGIERGEPRRHPPHGRPAQCGLDNAPGGDRPGRAAAHPRLHHRRL